MTDNQQPAQNDKIHDEESRQLNADVASQDQKLNDAELDNVSGGGLLLPAVKSAREAARRD